MTVFVSTTVFALLTEVMAWNRTGKYVILPPGDSGDLRGRPFPVSPVTPQAQAAFFDRILRYQPEASAGPEFPVGGATVPYPPFQAPYSLPRSFSRKFGPDQYSIGITPTRFTTGTPGSGWREDQSAFATTGDGPGFRSLTTPFGWQLGGEPNIQYLQPGWVHFGAVGVERHQALREPALFNRWPASFPPTPFAESGNTWW